MLNRNAVDAPGGAGGKRRRGSAVARVADAGVDLHAWTIGAVVAMNIAILVRLLVSV